MKKYSKDQLRITNYELRIKKTDQLLNFCIDKLLYRFIVVIEGEKNPLSVDENFRVVEKWSNVVFLDLEI